jgi:hypothetical protein
VVYGDQSHIKINWSGTITSSGITIITEGKARPGSVIPSAPKNFQCSAVNPSEILLKWTAPAEIVLGFIIELKIGESFQQIARLNPGDTSYTDTGLLSSKEYVYRIRSFNAQNVSDPSAEIAISTSESNNGDVLIALNAGGNAYRSKNGVEYAGDASSGFVSGGQVYSTTAAIGNTEDTVLYQSERYGDFNYSIPLQNGIYNAVLKFAEIYQDNPGARIFSVYIEGTEVVHELDLYFRTGKYKAYDVVVPVELNDGTMNINFVSITDNAKLSALEICKRNTSAIHNTGTTQIPKEFSLGQNYPNPFNPSTTIAFTIGKECFVSLKIYDVLGREIKTLIQEMLPAGRYSAQYDAAGSNSGVYFYRINAGNFSQSKKMLLLR